MNSADIMGAYADIQSAVSGLMSMSRQLREGSIPPVDENLKLLEEGLHVVGHELLEIARALRQEVEATAETNREARAFLADCEELLRKHEAQAVRDGLVPAIIADRVYRGAPAESFQSDRYDIQINHEAGVVVVREKPGQDEARGNVVLFPGSVARAVWQGRTNGGDAP